MKCKASGSFPPPVSEGLLELSFSFHALWIWGNLEHLKEPSAVPNAKTGSILWCDWFCNMSKTGVHVSYFCYSYGILNMVILANMTFLYAQDVDEILKLSLLSNKLHCLCRRVCFSVRYICLSLCCCNWLYIPESKKQTFLVSGLFLFASVLLYELPSCEIILLVGETQGAVCWWG